MIITSCIDREGQLVDISIFQPRQYAFFADAETLQMVGLGNDGILHIFVDNEVVLVKDLQVKVLCVIGGLDGPQVHAAVHASGHDYF